jgi:hypothetical protein
VRCQTGLSWRAFGSRRVISFAQGFDDVAVPKRDRRGEELLPAGRLYFCCASHASLNARIASLRVGSNP